MGGQGPAQASNAGDGTLSPGYTKLTGAGVVSG